jgi:hypothetical protein
MLEIQRGEGCLWGFGKIILRVELGDARKSREGPLFFCFIEFFDHIFPTLCPALKVNVFLNYIEMLTMPTQN